MSWTNAELYALANHYEVCKKWFHGRRCINAAMIDKAFYELIKGENK